MIVIIVIIVRRFDYIILLQIRPDTTDTLMTVYAYIQTCKHTTSQNSTYNISYITVHTYIHTYTHTLKKHTHTHIYTHTH
jgi:hypothetical protein